MVQLHTGFAPNLTFLAVTVNASTLAILCNLGTVMGIHIVFPALLLGILGTAAK
jgi:hypothetical protein